ncbi:hypothetical protein AC629_33680 [Bradyrhizobium sp. NAS80.1]|uniref:hypothetical protein n=1 Tax=Bradyrhizobium sp. NAS80.1 TaxID=1680159 RepID=UPI000963EF27|nr:hypothetical protein [Bradyrhizobium sp. NAS80.1]OKO75714.1 hypothetical protein AC629_33680 [Bradyrhizobium sp. NAS80.1]
MVDVLGVKAGGDLDAYLEGLAYILADQRAANWEDDDTPHWIPIPALALAIKRIWADPAHWGEFRQRPSIPGIVERCRDYRHDLVTVRHSLRMLGRTRQRLDLIIRTVDDYEADPV